MLAHLHLSGFASRSTLLDLTSKSLGTKTAYEYLAVRFFKPLWQLPLIVVAYHPEAH